MTAADTIAQALVEAARTRTPLTAPFTDADALDARTAYDIQDRVVQGRPGEVIGAKLGLTSRAKQEQMKVDAPLYGRLTADMTLAFEEPLDLGAFIHPRAEPEIGFLIGSELAAPATVASVLAGTERVFAAIEIIDSRYDGFRFRLPDVIADNASSAGFTVGTVSAEPDRLGDLRLVGCVLRVDGRVAATAAGAAVLGHPAASVAWLVNALAQRGRRLAAGSIVLSGSLTDAVPVMPGTRITAEFDGLGVAGVRA